MSAKKFNPRKYIISRGRQLPVYKCLVSDQYENKGLTICLIIREQPGGKYTFANFVVDRFCLGVKDAFANCNFELEELDELISRMAMNGQTEEVTPVYFHNLIYAAIDFAEDLGFKPHKDFYFAEYVLDPELVDDGIDDIEVGLDGKPLFVPGPYDNVEKILATLDRTVGPGNYEMVQEI